MYLYMLCLYSGIHIELISWDLILWGVDLVGRHLWSYMQLGTIHSATPAQNVNSYVHLISYFNTAAVNNQWTGLLEWIGLLDWPCFTLKIFCDLQTKCTLHLISFEHDVLPALLPLLCIFSFWPQCSKSKSSKILIESSWDPNQCEMAIPK